MFSMPCRSRYGAALGVVAWLLCALPAEGEILQRFTLAAASGEVATSGHVLRFSLGQELTIGASAAGLGCPTSGAGAILQSGFWGLAGTAVPAVRLFVVKGGAANPDLRWSDSGAPYGVHRSADPATLPYPELSTTSVPAYTDTDLGDAYFYCVAPSAPGP